MAGLHGLERERRVNNADARLALANYVRHDEDGVKEPCRDGILRAKHE